MAHMVSFIIHTAPIITNQLGGFENLVYSNTSKYASELCDNGFTQWQTVDSNEDASVGPYLYSNVQWEYNRHLFGLFSLFK